MNDSYEAFRNSLFEAHMLWPTGVDGVYLRSAAFESIIEGINNLVSAAGADQQATVMYPPLVVPRVLLRQTDYIRSFPDLSGSISSFAGDERAFREMMNELDAGEDFAPYLDVTDLGLCSAACHPIYPTVQSPLPTGGAYFEVLGNCFRNEPSVDPARLQVFRQHEFVFIGDEASAFKHREQWVERGLELLERLGLEVEAVIANDPFFGRSGAMLAANQRSDALKIELVCAICSAEAPTAITSSNCHLDHFGTAFGLTLEDGSTAHSACVGFGLERIAFALLHTHGLELGSWPHSVRSELGI